VVAGERLVLNAGRAGMALDKDTGERLWTSGRGPGGYATPVLAELRGKPGVVLFGDGAVYGVDLSNGAELWSFEWQNSSDVNAADPVVFDGKVFVASAYGKGCGLYDVSKPYPLLVWRSTAFQTHFSSFVFLGGYIYGIDGKLLLLNDDGVLTVAEASVEGFRPLASARILEGPDAWALMALVAAGLKPGRWPPGSSRI
jgi:outer membrane protein assembly factor BamB